MEGRMYYHPSFPDWGARITTVTLHCPGSVINAMPWVPSRTKSWAEQGAFGEGVEAKGDRRSNCRGQSHLLKLLFSSQVSNQTQLSQPALLRVANKLKRQNPKHDYFQLHCALAQVPMPERLCSGQSCSWQTKVGLGGWFFLNGK